MLSRITRQNFVGEAVSTLRTGALLRRDLRPILPDAIAGDDVVVLVHGFMASAGVFRPMRARLERDANARVASFSHAPGWGVRRIARSLAELVDRIPHGTRIHLVGHSLGGVVARWYVQEMGGHARVAQTISMASPFRGAAIAERLKIFIGGDLHATSEVLERIRARADEHGVPHTSIIAAEDRLIYPAKTAEFHHGEIHVLEGRGHNTLLFDPEVIDLVVKRVLHGRLT
jgi:pimeloyl-ACP methyl ester carboxylesterase